MQWPSDTYRLRLSQHFQGATASRRRERVVESRAIGFAQANVECVPVFAQMAFGVRFRNHDQPFFSQKPGEGDLGRRCPVPFCDLSKRAMAEQTALFDR